MADYDTIGAGYATRRRADPRIAERVARAVGPGRVVNVGAGAGSYEPPGTRLAVEPSAVMIAQRPPGAARCVQASAEAIPAEDGAFDVALAVLTVHHWTDLERGVCEMQRVARRVVVLTWDASLADRFWLFRDYLPESAAHDRRRFPPVAALAERLEATVEPVPIPHDCTDGFACAFWRRPDAYLDPAVRAGASNFAELGAHVRPAMARLAGDLASAAWRRRNRAILDADALDLGYRLLTTP